METYTTRQGDCWDSISYAVYGSESFAGWLMENNFRLLDIYQFGDGAEVNTPALPDTVTDRANRPPWRAGA